LNTHNILKYSVDLLIEKNRRPEEWNRTQATD